jgi:translation initiation factor IF-2
MVVAINKMDKPAADPQKVKQELATLNVLVEDWGGNVPVAEISAKTGQGVDTLLELLLLVAEMEELKADPNAPAEGVVIESQLDRRRGPIATLLVQNGTLKKEDAVLAGDAFAKIKLLENFEGRAVSEAPPSSPVRVLGWEKLPQVGEHFRAGSREEELRSFVKEITELRSKSAAQPGDILLIVKADVAGSEEALLEALKKIAPEDIKISILSSGVGDVSESDVKLAYASGAIILAFRVRILPEAAFFLKHQPVRIITSDIIYELLELVEKEIARVREEKNLAAMRTRLEVLALFGLKGNRQIIGGKVIEGVLKKRMLMAVIRRGEKIGKAKIINLQKEKRDVEEVETGAECGLLVETALKILKGDILEEIKDEEN